MSEQYSTASSDSQKSASKVPKWLLIAAIVVVVVVLACAACVAVTLLSPSITMSLLPGTCQQTYPDLSTEQCEAWARGIASQHFDEYLTCFDGSASTLPIDPNATLQCLDNKGLGPND